MKRNRHIGLERHDGLDVGRDPRSMPNSDLEQLGHARVSPLRALRLKCRGGLGFSTSFMPRSALTLVSCHAASLNRGSCLA